MIFSDFTTEHTLQSFKIRTTRSQRLGRALRKPSEARAMKFLIFHDRSISCQTRLAKWWSRKLPLEWQQVLFLDDVSHIAIQ